MKKEEFSNCILPRKMHRWAEDRVHISPSEIHASSCSVALSNCNVACVLHLEAGCWPGQESLVLTKDLFLLD